MLSNFGPNLNVVIIGASGGIGNALIQHLVDDDKVNFIHAFSRSEIAIDHPKVLKNHIDLKNEQSIEFAAKEASKEKPLDIVIIATGILHGGSIKPEKSVRDISFNNFSEIFAVNTIGPAIIMKYFLPHLNRDSKSVFAAISARVGSISDNYLGGWYAYRSSKSALNMLIKTASIEMARKHKKAIVIGLHPGTVKTDLSEPFSKNIEPVKIFTPKFSAEKLLNVINDISTDKTGKVLAWDGKCISA